MASKLTGSEINEDKNNGEINKERHSRQQDPHIQRHTAEGVECGTWLAWDRAEAGGLSSTVSQKSDLQGGGGGVLPIPLSACIHSSFQQIFLNVFNLVSTGLDFGDRAENRPDKN